MRQPTLPSRFSHKCKCERKKAPRSRSEPAVPASQSVASNTRQSTQVYLLLPLSPSPSLSAALPLLSSTYRHYPSFLRERRRNRRWWGCIIASITEIIYTSIMSISPYSLSFSHHYLSRTAMTAQLGQTKLHRQREHVRERERHWTENAFPQAEKITMCSVRAQNCVCVCERNFVVFFAYFSVLNCTICSKLHP